MKSVLRIIGAALYGYSASWILYLIVWFVKPYIMSIEFGWILLLYIILYATIVHISYKISSLLITPFVLVGATKKHLILPFLCCIGYGFQGLVLPFADGIDDFGFLQWFLALSVSYLSLQFFASFMMGMLMVSSMSEEQSSDVCDEMNSSQKEELERRREERKKKWEKEIEQRRRWGRN